MIRWLHMGKLSMIPESYVLSYPGNSELWQLLFLSTGPEGLVNVSLVPIGIFCGVMIYGVARELGASPSGAAIPAAITLCCPMIALQMYSTYADIFGTVFVVGAWYWILVLFRNKLASKRQLSCALMAGLCIGLANGAKWSFLAWTAAVVAVAVFFLFAQKLRERALTWKGFGVFCARWSTCLMAGVTITSGFWHFRGIWESGWLLFPFQIEIAGIPIGAGLDFSDFQ